MPASDFKDALKQQADIVRIVGDYVKLKKAGAQNFSGLCPFHNEKTPSFSVHATRQFFHCFGCGVSGDVSQLRSENRKHHLSRSRPTRSPRNLASPCPRSQFSSPQEAQEAKLRTALLDIHERACAFFQDYLKRPKELTPANTWQDAASMTIASHAFASATRPTQASSCAMPCAANSTKSCCERAACSRGKKLDTDRELSATGAISRLAPRARAARPAQQPEATSPLKLEARSSKPDALSPSIRSSATASLFPIAQRPRPRHRLHRPHPLDRREGRPEVSQLARDRDLFEVARAL